MAIGKWLVTPPLGSQIFTSSATSTTTITAAALADVASQYIGQMAIPLQGGMSGEGRYITAYNGTNQITVSPAWAADPGAASAGVIEFAIGPGDASAVKADTAAIKAKTDLIVVSGADVATNTDPFFVVGNKSDAAVTTVGVVASIIAYVKGILGKTNLILPGTKIVTKTSTSTLTTGTLFNWAGSIQIVSVIGRVTTVIQGQATTVKLGIQADALTIEDMCATLDINAFAVGTLLGLTGTYTDAMQGTTGKPTKPPTTPINATCITSGIIKVTYGAASTGAIVWEIVWFPLNAAGSVTAA